MKKMLVLAMLAVASLVFTGVGVSAQSVDSSGPKEQLQHTINSILNVLRCDSTDAETKKHDISAIVRQRFDYPTMAQGVLGRRWLSTAEQERVKFVDLFTQLLETTYLGRISSYKGQEIVYAAAEIRDTRAVVDTLIKNDGTEIPISYRLIPRDGNWVVYDVIIENVSLIRNYRSSYNNILRNKGMAALLDEMAQKIESLNDNQERAKQGSA